MMRNLLGIALVGFLVVGVAGSAGAVTLSYTGTVIVGIGYLPPATGTVSGSYVGPTHISTISFSGGQFGPITASVPVTSNATIASVRLTGVGNLAGTMTGISGGAPGGGPMGLSGLAKICLFDPGACVFANVSVPLSPVGGVGMGIGGTQLVSGGVALTMQHQPWTVGTVTMTNHLPGSTVTTFVTRGFASPPSATAQNSGVLQLVTASKVYTSLTAAFPEVPVFSVLNLHFLGEPTPTPTPAKKVTLCHMGKKTISVGANAVPAHLKHGDALGECGGSSPEPTPTPMPTPTPPPPTPTPASTPQP